MRTRDKHRRRRRRRTQRAMIEHLDRLLLIHHSEIRRLRERVEYLERFLVV